jgi:hypothetical protein
MYLLVVCACVCTSVYVCARASVWMLDVTLCLLSNTTCDWLFLSNKSDAFFRKTLVHSFERIDVKGRILLNSLDALSH